MNDPTSISKGFLVQSADMEYLEYDGKVFMAPLSSPLNADGRRDGTFVCKVNVWENHPVNRALKGLPEITLPTGLKSDDMCVVKDDKPNARGVTRLYKVTSIAKRSAYLAGVNCPDAGWVLGHRIAKMTFPGKAEREAIKAQQKGRATALPAAGATSGPPRANDAPKGPLRDVCPIWRDLVKAGALKAPETRPGGACGDRDVCRTIPRHLWPNAEADFDPVEPDPDEDDAPLPPTEDEADEMHRRDLGDTQELPF